MYSFALQHKHAKRVKIVTAWADEVDAFFVDQRPIDGSNGGKLVICTEGNGGFYEIGIMATPLEAGYSVLGWNHLGFGGSTGKELSLLGKVSIGKKITIPFRIITEIIRA